MGRNGGGGAGGGRRGTRIADRITLRHATQASVSEAFFTSSGFRSHKLPERLQAMHAKHFRPLVF